MLLLILLTRQLGGLLDSKGYGIALPKGKNTICWQITLNSKIGNQLEMETDQLTCGACGRKSILEDMKTFMKSLMDDMKHDNDLRALYVFSVM